MKTLKSFFVVIMALVVITIDVLAIESATIGGQDIIANNGVGQKIAINISDNPGIMGYKLSITYPQNVKVLSIERGQLCQEGLFDSSLENHSDNKIDVVWSGTQNTIGDGSLFYINLIADSAAVGEELKISYSIDDSFDESWNSVALFCNSISIVSGYPKETESVKISDKDYDDIKTLIEEKLNDVGANSVDNLAEDQVEEFVSEVDKSLQNVNVADIEDVKKIYRESLINDFLSVIRISEEKNGFVQMVDGVFVQLNIKNFDEISEKRVDGFLCLLSEQLKEKYPETVDSFDKLNNEEKIKTIERLYLEMNNENTEIKDWIKGNIEIVIVFFILIVIVPTILLIILKGKRKRDKKRSAIH